MTMQQSRIQFSRTNLTWEVKSALGDGIFPYATQVGLNTFKGYNYLLRYTKLYQGCILSYGSLSEEFKKKNIVDSRSFCHYLKHLISVFETLSSNPYGFVFNDNFECNNKKQVKDQIKYKEDYQITSTDFGLNQQEFGIQIDRAILQILRNNLEKCFTIYDKQFVDQTKTKYKEMIKYSNNPAFIRMNPYSPQQWSNVLYHGLNINLLNQILSDFRQVQSKLKKLSEDLCKPIAQKFCVQVSEKLVNYIQLNPNFDVVSQKPVEAERQYVFKKKSQMKFLDWDFQDEYYKKTCYYKLKDFMKEQQNNNSQEYKEYQAVIKSRLEAKKNIKK